MRPFVPLHPNPHFLTIAANFAQRRLHLRRFPVRERLYETEPGVQVLVHEHRPEGQPRGELVMVHGLEGSSDAGYIRSMSQLALEHGFAVHRTNMRSCGGTEALCRTMYHAGLTTDTLCVLRSLRERTSAPLFLTGYSLGGNVALKLAGELGRHARPLLDGVCAVSTPIDLAASVRKMSRRENRIYEWRFLTRLKQRIRKRSQSLPGVYDLNRLARAASVFEFDDAITAPSFGFGDAPNYYSTQSSIRFLDRIAVPALLIQAEDDPLIPFDLFESAAVRSNPHIRLIASAHGGHLGFLSNASPRFWVDRVILAWMEETLASSQ